MRMPKPPKTRPYMVIEVKQSHIDNAKRGDGHCCPIALAIEEIYPYSNPFVDDSCVEMDMDGLTVEVYINSYVSSLISAWDKGYSLNPFEFDLPVEEAEVREIDTSYDYD
jgi:hypothetical protein